MRKILAVMLLFGMVQIVHANSDKYGSERPSLWRSSETCAVESFVSIASGTVHFHSVTITSPTHNIESFVNFFNTAATATLTGQTWSTGPVVNTTSMLIAPIPPNQEVVFDVPMSSGLAMNKSHEGVCIRTKWDYIPSRSNQVFGVLYKP